MKKALVFLLVLAAVAGGATWYFVSFKMDSLIKSQIESSASASFGTRVSVGDVKTDIKGGSLTISSVTVANPPGFNNKNAFTLNGIEAALDYSTLEIKRVIIDKPEIVIEEMGGQTNFDKMLASMKKGSPEPAPEKESAGEGGKREEPVITIRHFRMNESRAAFESESLDKYSNLEVDAIEVSNVKGTPSEVARVIANEVISEIVKEAATEMLKAKAQDKISEILGKKKD